jgi:hypothetical protein
MNGRPYTPAALPQEQGPHSALSGRQAGPQRQSGRFGENKFAK